MIIMTAKIIMNIIVAPMSQAPRLSSGIFLNINHFVRRNKKIVYFLLAVVGLILLLLIGLIIALIPMMLSGIDYLYTHGIKGIVDILLGLLKMLWEGSGK